MRVPLPAVVLLVALVGPVSGRAAPPQPAPEFDRDVKPILARHCAACHGPDKPRGGLRLDRRADALAGGDSGGAIRPGKPAESLLLARVTSDDPAGRMPPTGAALTAAEVAVLRAWVEAGAKWPADPADVPAEHWAFRPPARPAVPAPRKPQNAARVRNPIDAFVLAKLDAAGLKPAPEADRRTLIRRLKFDLLGLPPTPEEVDAFERDPSATAYEQLVGAYLASPHFGERWARHWLDAVRFAESDGFEMNWERPAAWPYRDYVIRAFNADTPFDRFVREQLAGDTSGADAATGFLVGGPWDRVKSPDPVLTANQRADELHDILGTAGSAFLGLTVGCARCHNHKFDPITQADYYRFKAVFAGVRHGERAWRPEPGADAGKLEAARGELARADAALAALEPLADPKATSPRRPPVGPRANVERFAPVRGTAVRFVVLATNQGEPCLDELEVFGPDARRLDLAGAALRSSGDFPGAPAIHRLEFLTDGKYGNGRSWISNEAGRGWVEVELPQPAEVGRVEWGRDREGKYADRVPTRYRVEVKAAGGAWVTVASSDDRLPFGKPAPPAPPGLTAADRAAWDRLTATRDALRGTLAGLERGGVVYAGKLGTPDPTFRFHRGDPTLPREAVGPGVIAGLGLKLAIPADATDPQRRLALAGWVTDPAHPLTARVIVNRLWQHHLGTGIVDTPSDFGRNGGTPSHPELLDWLASELVAPAAGTPWSLKHVHRLIVTSATYRQASASDPTGAAKDARARLLWRHPPRRLDAEAIRDSILFVSGALDLAAGGPGFSPFEPNANYVRVYTPKAAFGPPEFRRMIYQHQTRMQADATFGAFDCPDGGQIAPRRNASTTPLQALNLLNSKFMLQQADAFAGRVTKEAGAVPAAQVGRAFQLAFQRAPSAAEAAAAARLVAAHGLPALCRALLNANEFLYVD